MAMDIVMVKGDTKIKISPDFKEYYEKRGFTVEGENKKISVYAEIKDDFVEIKIIDQGYGIPKTSLGRVTERFFRVDPEHSKKIGGTGLGLAIVKHLINQHRGEFHIESEIGKGSEFFVKLPLHN